MIVNKFVQLVNHFIRESNRHQVKETKKKNYWYFEQFGIKQTENVCFSRQQEEKSRVF